MPGPLRLFVALYPPPGAAAAMQAELTALAASLPPFRAVPADQVHLTLQFIGDTQERDLGDVTESVAASARGLPAFDLVATRLITLPVRGPARLVAAQTDAPSTLLELHRRLVTRLARTRAKHERFTPHLTLCRFRAPAARTVLDAPLHIDPFNILEIVLVRSILREGGARHSAVARWRLG